MPLSEGDPLPPDDRVCKPGADQLDAVYRAERRSLLRMLCRRTTAEHAADLVQQVFVRFIGLDAVERSLIASPRAYLRRSAINLSADAARSANRHHAIAHIPLDEIELTAPDQLAALEARDVLGRIETSLLHLKPRTREIFLAHRIDGYSYIEIAAKTGMSVKGVEKHMTKAIAHIDRALGDC